jgi:hypothetical protein
MVVSVIIFATAGFIIATPLGSSTTPSNVGSLASVVVAEPALLPHDARVVGAMAPTKVLQLSFALSPRNQGALAKSALAISTPGSSSYHRYLSTSLIASRFGPSAREIAQVSTTLYGLGLTVGALSSNRLMLDVTGTVAKVTKALHSQLLSVRLSGGQLGWRLASKATLPSNIGHEVSAVIGLNNITVEHDLLDHSTVVSQLSRNAVSTKATSLAKTVPANRSEQPVACAGAIQATRSEDGWTDDEIGLAYGLPSLYADDDLGAGQSVAVVELEPFLMSDIKTFDRCYFGVSHATQVHRVNVDGFNEVGSGSGEAALDIEAISALAPAASIDVYEAPNTTIGTLDSYNEIVSQDRANIISTSWGECEQMLDTSSPGTRQVENFIFEEAAAQGQTFVAATGDSGSDDCATTPFRDNKAVAPYLSVDDPASQPYVLAVGGSSLHHDQQPLTSDSETAWNDGVGGGASGGGVSSSWSSPSWQTNSGVPGVSTTLGRQVPDVVASADSEAGITVYSASFGGGGWTTIGGTSAAAPIWAAVLAEIAGSGDAGTSCSMLTPRVGGPDLGFVPPLLYEAAANSYATDFHAISSGTNDMFGLGLGYVASAGYNLVGGLGSPIVTNPGGQPGLASSLCNEATSQSSLAISRPVPVSVSPDFGPTTGGTSVTIGLSSPILSGAKVSVTFDGLSATVSSATGSQITVVTPPASTTFGASPVSAAGPSSISVTEANGSSSATSVPAATANFEYVSESTLDSVSPSVSGVNPASGRTSGGGRISIYGSGFSSGTPTVTIGGRKATHVAVLSDYLLTATVPRKTSASNCSTGIGFVPGSLCQTSVIVRNANGANATSPILPVRSGQVSYSALGTILPTATTEVAPSVTEYDYAPRPTITRVNPSPISPVGQIVHIRGRGFSLNTLDWVNYGPSNSVNSQLIKLVSISSTEIEVKVPGARHDESKDLPGGVSVQSSAGLSKVKTVLVNGPPTVSSLSPSAGTDNAAVTITVHGLLLSGVNKVLLVNETEPGTDRTLVGSALVRTSRTSLTVRLPTGIVGSFEVVPCNTFGCATPHLAGDTYTVR